MMDLRLVGDVKDIEPIAVNLSIRERKKLEARFGERRWRKLKGVALVRFPTVKFATLSYIGTRPMA